MHGETLPLLPPRIDVDGPVQESPLAFAGTYRAVALAALAPLSFGYVIGYSSPTAAQLLASSTLTPATLSFFESLSPLGCACGALCGGLIADTYGRRVALVLLTLPLAVGWVGIATARSVPAMCAGRYLTGIGAGVGMNVAPLYISELAPPHLRGALGGCVQLGVNIGVTLAYALGLPRLGLGWRAVAWAGVAPAALLAALAPPYLPESPRWLVQEGRGGEAAAQLKRLRSPTSDVSRELQKINADLARAAAEEAAAGASTPPAARAALSRPLSIVLSLMVFQQLTGVNAVFFSLSPIFAAAGLHNSDAVATLVALATVLVSVAACFALDHAGRRSLLIAASVGCALGLGLLSLAFSDWLAAGAHSLAVAGALVFVISFSSGVGPVPWVLVGELLPPVGRGAAASAATILSNTMAFAVTGSFAFCSRLLTLSGIFLFFALCTLGCAAYTWFCLPETKGRSLESVQRVLQRNSRPWEEERPLPLGRSESFGANTMNLEGAEWTAAKAGALAA